MRRTRNAGRIVVACLVASTLAVITLHGGPPPLQQRPSHPPKEPGNLLVRLKPGVAADKWSERARGKGLAKQVTRRGRAHKVHIPKGLTHKEAFSALALDPDVQTVDYNWQAITHALSSGRNEPNDPLYLSDYQWNLSRIGLPDAWSHPDWGNWSKDQILVAVIDTGVNQDHEDLQQVLAEGWNFAAQDNLMDDVLGHGTAVAGILAAQLDNGLGLACVGGPVILVPLKVDNAEGKIYLDAVLAALEYVEQENIPIVNVSLGFWVDSPLLRESVERVSSSGSLIVAAAGNTGGDDLLYPAAYPDVMAVAATDASDNKTGFSTTGAHLDVAAPGERISTARNTGSSAYGELTGTSASAAHVSALAALLVAQGQGPSAVKRNIEESAQDVNESWLPGKDEQLGYGRINVARALGYDQAISEATPEATPPNHTHKNKKPRTFKEAGPPRALVVLNPQVEEVKAEVRKKVEALGGRIHVTFDKGGSLIATLDPRHWKDLRKLEGVQGVYPDKVPEQALRNFSGDQRMILRAWNRMLDPGPRPDLPDPLPLRKPDTITPPPRPTNRTLGEAETLGFYPHDKWVTSHYMIGHVRVEVIFLESDGSIDPSTEDWDAERIESCLSAIGEGMIYWTNQIEARYPHPGFSYASYTNSLTWTINWQTVPTGYEPIQNIGSTTDGTDGSEVWVADAMANLGFNNPYASWAGYYRTYDFLETRRTIDDDWIFAIYVVDSLNDPDGEFTAGPDAFANLGGSYEVISYDVGSTGHYYFSTVAAHETAHIFYALDEYSGSSSCAEVSSGLYAVPNWNYEDACVYDVPCIMRGDVSVYNWDTPLCYDLSDKGTDDQIGWRDANTNGVLDAVDTTPNATLNPYPVDPTALTILTYTGSAQDAPDATSPGTRIMGGDFRIDGGDWIPILEADFVPGVKYSSVTFSFDTPALIPGTHDIEIRIMNQIGRYGYSSDTVTVTGNTATTTPTVTPGAAATTTPTTTHTATSTVTNTVTPRTDGMDEWGAWNTNSLWHMVEDGVSPYPNNHSPPHSMWYGRDATGDYDDGTANSGSFWTDGWFYGITTNSYLTFWSWEETEGTVGLDRREVGVQRYGSGAWDWPWISTDNSAAWRLVTIDLSAYAGDAIRITFWFGTESTANNNFRGWYVDDIQIQQLTPTPTSTPTGTSTPTATPSGTPTHSPSPTDSHTSTSTATASTTATPTSTLTATTSATPTATPTVTLSATRSGTASQTPSVTISHTATATSSITVTATLTDTSTETPKHSITVSPTITETGTLTSSQTVTGTATPSPSHTTSHTTTATGTVTRTATPTDTPSATPTISKTPTPSTSHTPTHSPSATPSMTKTATATATKTTSGTGTPSATPSHSPTRSPTRSVTGTVSETATPTWTASATPSASPSATATATPTASPPATTTITATVTDTSTITPTLTAKPPPTATHTPAPGVLEIEDLSFYPNPYHGEVEGRIVYKLNAPADLVRLKVFTLSSRMVLDKRQVSVGYGRHEHFIFNGRDNLGNKLANGVYLFVLEASGKSIVDKRSIVRSRKIGKLVILR